MGAWPAPGREDDLKLRPIRYKPLISVVVPTFNRARQVQSALRSVLAQTYPEFEVIIVDDGSTDGTGEALQELIRRRSPGDRQVRYFFQPNQGQSAARNKGIDDARGEWIAFLDSDDVWLPGKLDGQVRAIEHFQGRFFACVTDARLIDDLGMDSTAFRKSGKEYGGKLGLFPAAAQSLVNYRDPFWISTLLVRIDTLKQAGRFDPQLRYAEDHDLLFRLSLVTPICYVNDPLCVIDRTKSPPLSVCRPWDSVEVRLRGTQAMLESWLKMGSKLPPDIRKAVVRNLRHVHSAWANWHLEHKRYKEARQSASAAIKYQLTSGLAIKWTLTGLVPSIARRISPRMRFS